MAGSTGLEPATSGLTDEDRRTRDNYVNDRTFCPGEADLRAIERELAPR
jgi:hypothetical protein